MFINNQAIVLSMLYWSFKNTKYNVINGEVETGKCLRLDNLFSHVMSHKKQTKNKQKQKQKQKQKRNIKCNVVNSTIYI